MKGDFASGVTDPEQALGDGVSIGIETGPLIGAQKGPSVLRSFVDL
jgi:hypothetical protein